MAFGKPSTFYRLSCELYPNRLVSDVTLTAVNFNDVTLVSDDGLYQEEFSANKSVLSASSEFLESVLIDASDPNPKVFLQGINKEDVRLILDYIYTGVVKVKEESIDRILSR